jgi:hypothetical protein
MKPDGIGKTTKRVGDELWPQSRATDPDDKDVGELTGGVYGL